LADRGPATFGGVLRRLRADAGLTQEELAEAAGVSPRSVSDLERGVNLTARRDTARLLADALGLTGAARTDFEAAARGRPLPGNAVPGHAVPGNAVPGGAVAATRTLPRDITSFAGRQRELQELADAVAGSGVVSIRAIGGMAGVGKTAFAVHAAHRLAERFPGGQIFLSLHGHTPGRRPVDPTDALASLLLTAGVPAAQIPPGVEARMALWRDRLAEQQLLLVLDDAASSEQVRPLLPGVGGSLVLVTSRRHLTALEDAMAISLDTLAPDEAAGLLVRLSGRAGLSVADPAVQDIIQLCGYLPLAIGMVARQLHHHPAWTAAEQAVELAGARDRLELLATENVSVAAAFDLSYEELAPAQQRLFRRLGLHPGTDIDAYAAAALDGSELAVARRGLEVLYGQYLLTEPARGRYRMHDLIREHAHALAGRLDPDDDRHQASAHLLDYYQQTAALADSLLARQARPVPDPAAGTGSAAVPALSGREQALEWVRVERANLLACLDQATRAGQDARIVALTAGLAGLLRQDGPWTEASARHAAALGAARSVGDRLGQANVLTDIADMRRLASGDYPAATRDLTEALDIYRDLGDRLGQANALTDLGYVRRAMGDYPAAAQDLAEAVDIYRDLGDRRGQANALAFLGGLRRLAGDYPAATRDLTEALDISIDLGDRLGQATVLTFLGIVRRATGDYPAAIRELAESLDIFRDLGDQRGQANALTFLGNVRGATGDYPAATHDLEEALSIFSELRSPPGQANAYIYLAVVSRLAGDHAAATRDLGEALGIYRDLGDRGGEVEALNEAGALSRVRGDLGNAETYHQQALRLARQIGSSWYEAEALAGLGRCARAVGHVGEATDRLQQALEIFRRIGAAEAAGVSAELQALTDPGRPSEDHDRP
jgi:tetratricopeptide (TPR) repeat protein/transcriptional regulator with XRE-family HTH domain